MQNNNFTKYILIAFTVWITLQIPRYIAIPIIGDVLNGIDDDEWMFPAILDIVVATLSPIALFLIWKNPHTYSWTFLICYFAISIIDHGNAVIAVSLAKVPQTFIKMGVESGGNVPIIQSAIDLFCIVLLFSKGIRTYFNLSQN